VALVTPACARETTGDSRMAQPAVTEMRACAADAPPQWADVISRSAVDTGGSTMPRAVGPAGEVVAARDTGTGRDLVLIRPEPSVTNASDAKVAVLYALPDPDMSVFGYAGIDDRWIVFAVEHLPRNANGVLPTVTRIEVIDRRTGERRTVAARSVADAAAIPERNVLDAVTLSEGKVYWITHDTYNSPTGVGHMFDPATDLRTVVASGPIDDMTSGRSSLWPDAAAALPDAVTALLSGDRTSVGTDGSAYGWIRGGASGGTEIGYWSPLTGVVTVGGVDGMDGDLSSFTGPVLVFDSFVILDAGGSATTLGASAVFVDMRSGAVVDLKPRNSGAYDQFVASRGGTLAVGLTDNNSKQPGYQVGLIRANQLVPPAC